ncbi:MAG TPA: protein TolR [Gammaproteobacteria bacterium]
MAYKRRKPMSEINVVPYIDVMLVLLVIFMITAPLLTKGVEVDLPNTTTEPMPQTASEPVVLTVDAKGNYYLNIGDNPDKPIKRDKMKKLVATALKHKPNTPVLVRGDGNVSYQKVITAMSVLKSAGVPKVGLVTEPDES